MSVADRWHIRNPREVKDPDSGEIVPARKCREHKMWPAAEHGIGGRWQVRYRDEDGEQKSKNFALKDGKDVEIHAAAFDADVTANLNAGTYIDPDAGRITFREYAEEVIENRTVDPGTRIAMRGRMNKHVYPVIGRKEMRLLSRRPSMIQALVQQLQKKMAPRSVGIVMANVVTVFSCAVNDEVTRKNPCRSSNVVLPAVLKEPVIPWTIEQLVAMRAELPARYRAMIDVGAGLGLRQGEIFGLSPDDIDWLRGIVHVKRQVKILNGKLIFALPKGGKVRDVPLTEVPKLALAAHMQEFPPPELTLPWRERDGEPHTARLFFTSPRGGALRRNRWNPDVWHPALERAGIVKPPNPGTKRGRIQAGGMHGLRHYFASVLLTEGEAVQAVSQWMGHHSPSVTWNIYAHLMPKSETRMRTIMDRALKIFNASALDVPAEAR